MNIPSSWTRSLRLLLAARSGAGWLAGATTLAAEFPTASLLHPLQLLAQAQPAKKPLDKPLTAEERAARESLSRAVSRLHAQGIRFYERATIDDQPEIRVIVAELPDENRLQIEDDKGKILVSYASERFDSRTWVRVAQQAEPILLTFWAVGVHGQAVVAWNPYKQRTPLFRLTSSWPILAEQELKRIKLTILGDMRPDGTPAPTELVWDGGGLPEPAPKTAKPAGAKAKGASVPK